MYYWSLDNFLLTVMTYDSYVAIRQPLHYSTIMRQELCVFLVAGSWFLCCIHALLHTLLLFNCHSVWRIPSSTSVAS